MGTQGLSYMRVERLMLRLPIESRLMCSFRESPIPWKASDEILANIFDALALQLWQKENEGKKPNQQTKRPERYPRPGDELKSKQEASKRAELAARLLEQKERLSIGKSNVQN